MGVDLIVHGAGAQYRRKGREESKITVLMSEKIIKNHGTNKKETMPGTGNLANYLGLMKS